MSDDPDLREPASLARELIRCPSITPEEAGAQQRLKIWLERLGFEITDLPFNGVSNFWAYRQGRGGGHLCFSGHTDVVPPGDPGLWRHAPFEGRIADNTLYGRGAVDMKGAIACFIAALARQDEEDTPSVSLAITGDEEGPGHNGTCRMIPWIREHGNGPDYVLVGEPSSEKRIGDQIRIGRRGSLHARLGIHGIQGHVAYPERLINPISVMIPALARLAHWKPDHGSENFPPSTLAITALETEATAPNVTPAWARARIAIRFNDLWTSDRLAQALKAEIAAACPDGILETESHGEAFLNRDPAWQDTVRKAVEDVTGIKPRPDTGGGRSDAAHFAPHFPVLELGLRNATIHKVDENVPLEDLEVLTQIYEAVLKRVFRRISC